jgi:hypothetical protein
MLLGEEFVIDLPLPPWRGAVVPGANNNVLANRKAVQDSRLSNENEARPRNSARMRFPAHPCCRQRPFRRREGRSRPDETAA